jgi:hypothetical protein
VVRKNEKIKVSDSNGFGFFHHRGLRVREHEGVECPSGALGRQDQ